MGVWSKPTDWGAMTEDELMASIQMSRARDKQIRKAQQWLGKTTKNLGTAEKVVHTVNKRGLFDKLKSFLSHESGHDENKT